MNPYKLKDVFNYLTSNNQLLKKKLKLGTSEIPIPPKRDDVTTIEAINRFNKANPRVDTTNLKPLSVKHSNVRQSNVNEPNEGVIQGAYDTATREAQSEGFPAPSYDKFKSRYLKKNMKADGGRMGYKDGLGPSNQPMGPVYTTNKIEDAAKEVVKRLIKLDGVDIPLTDKISMSLGPGLNRTEIRGVIDILGGELNIGGGMKGDDKGIGFTFRKEFQDGGMLVQPSDDGSRPGYNGRKGKKDIITNYSLEVQKLIKDYGINKYKKLNPQQKYAVRNQPTSTTPYTFNFGKNKFDITVKGLTKKGANNIQELLNIINKEELTPENWFGKTSRKQGKKGGASAGVDAMARDLVKYLKGETIVGRTKIHQTIFDQLNIKDLIGKNKANILSQIDGKSFRQAIGTKEAAKSAVESSFDAVKYINKEFILDPDITLDELAEQIYGKGASNSVRAMKDTQLDILKYLDVLKTGTRRGIKIPNFDYPSKNKIFEILDSIEDRSSSFGFQDGAVRDLKFNIRDNLLNYKKGSTMDLRRLLSDIISESDFAGSVIDESVGLSATYDTMPGYTEATQILPDELNKYKSSKIDKPFNELLKKIGNGTATPEEIKNYNKVARAFIKETGVDAPIVRSSIIGDKISLKNIKKYIKNFDNFSSAAQKILKMWLKQKT
jgi:hypothetical protein